ncbi:50S ribosomal protein L23 [Candidatus Nomurabacteria bacterium]|nr:50S ribosomal protein L23 [Candidatus Nomurabacteria bacterium]
MTDTVVKNNKVIIPKDLRAVIVGPRITEKASMKAESNVYVFEVIETATKEIVEKAIKTLYKVSPIKINMIKIPQKKVFTRGKIGFKKGGKKAYVYLKKGDKIEII